MRTQLSAPEILKWAQSQEEDADRQRIEHWGPRTLDVDIIAIEGECVSSADLVVPHPRAHERAFVVVPLAELVDPESVLGERIDIDEGDVTAVTSENYPSGSAFREVTT
ncbi:MAG: 2-amino-4-hydroxy-6-hydroxymethyldihydropteridine diphosphokinase [Planctomycetes bacterium]|nr:2-amino-4-hydroxy-6-hydroxymethyldihydropteridine diphosphokinase [Planctomycetota bacterium]